MSDFTGPITYNFTGMDPNQIYDIALYSARGPYSSGAPRNNTFIISDVDAFTNSSSPGTAITTTTVSNDSTTVDIHASQENGYVARFTGITANADGEMQIDIDNQGNWNETNALRLAAAGGSGNHSYSGINLQPGENFTGAALSNADLTGASLFYADLTGADLTNATLTGATLTGANLHQALLPSAMPSLPVINGAVVTVSNALAVSGSVQVDAGGNLSVTSDSFAAGGVNIQGGTVGGFIYGLDLDEIGDISGHGQLFGHVDLGAGGTIPGSGTGLTLYGDVSGSGTVSGAKLFGNVDIGSSPGAITLEDVVLSSAGTTTFEVAGIDPSQFDRLTLVSTMALDGTAQISFDNFTPDPSNTFQLIDLTSGTASSWFSSVVAPAGWTLSTAGLLAVPEPSTVLLLGIGILCMAGYRRGSLV